MHPVKEVSWSFFAETVNGFRHHKCLKKVLIPHLYSGKRFLKLLNPSVHVDLTKSGKSWHASGFSPGVEMLLFLILVIFSTIYLTKVLKLKGYYPVSAMSSHNHQTLLTQFLVYWVYFCE